MADIFLATVVPIDEITSMLEHLSHDEIASVLKPAMQVLREKIVTSRIYHEATNDVFEMIVSKCSDIDEGGFLQAGQQTSQDCH